MRFPKYVPSDEHTKVAVIADEPDERALPPITEHHFWRVCQPGIPPTTCRYLTMGPAGIECAKGLPLGVQIDELHAAGQMRAQGDNCPGRTGSMPPEIWVRRMLS